VEEHLLTDPEAVFKNIPLSRLRIHKWTGVDSKIYKEYLGHITIGSESRDAGPGIHGYSEVVSSDTLGKEEGKALTGIV
jgi:hypothetical protein